MTRRFVALALLSVGCASSPTPVFWMVEDPGGLGVELRDARSAPPSHVLHVPGGPAVVPLGFRGNHWRVRTQDGREAWLEETDYPVPILTSRFARTHHIHVGTAFPFEDDEGLTSLSLQIDTRLRRPGLASRRMMQEARYIWSLYEPFARHVDRVSIILLAADIDPVAPLESYDGEVVGYRRAMRLLCMVRDGAAFGPLQPCRFDRRRYRVVPEALPQ